MVQPSNISKAIVSQGVSPNVSQVVSPILSQGVSPIMSQGVLSIVVSPIIIKTIDVRKHFTNEQEYESRDVIIKWICTEATKQGFGVVIGRSDSGSDIQPAFVTLTCKRSGIYRRPIKNFKRDDTDSRKCQCPLKLRRYRLANNNWSFNVLSGLHNHDLSAKLAGHPSACRLLVEEKEFVSDMTLNLIAPKNILATLKRKRPENISSIRKVYNHCYQTKLVLIGDRTKMQQLLKLLNDNNYICRHQRCEDGVTVRDIYWTHIDSIKLFTIFSTVLIIDSTCKTNKYRLSLLEIVSVTSTEMTYSIVFAFLECEKEDNFAWILKVCRSMLKDQENMPKVIITDHDTKLMNFVVKVFPSSSELLCKYHITKNVRSRVKPAIGTDQIEIEEGKVVKSGGVVEKIMVAWNVIINASTKDLYDDVVIHLRKVCNKYPDLLKYIETTILDQVKEKIVCAWTYQVMYLGNTSTNRVESAHACLKNWLGNNKGDLCMSCESVNQMILNQHNEIQTSFGRSITVLEDRFKDIFLYSQLVGNISRSSLNFIFYEAKRASDLGSDTYKCGCIIVKTYGLLCASVVSKKVKLDSPIRIDEVFSHWKRLSFKDNSTMEEVKSSITILKEWEAIQERFRKGDDNTKLHIKEQLRKISFSETTDSIG